MPVLGLDHIVLCVTDVAKTIDFYQSILGMSAREERPGKWSLYFGANKISLQDVATAPEIARNTIPGSGNFCVLCNEPVEDLVIRLQSQGIAIVAGPGERAGATGRILSVYLNDPDGNLVEVSNPLP